jgi:hypothetical protein
MPVLGNLLKYLYVIAYIICYYIYYILLNIIFNYYIYISKGTSPSIFGQAMASYVLCQLANKAYQPEVCERLSKNLKHKIIQAFRNTEKRRFNTFHDDINIDDDDIEFIVQQVN